MIVCPICNKPIELEIENLDLSRKRNKFLFRILITKMLEQYKEQNGLTLRELSRKLENRFHISEIDRWIKGHVIPNLNTAKFILEKLKR